MDIISKLMRSRWCHALLLVPGLVLSLGFLGLFKDKLDPVQFMLALEDFRRICSTDPAAAFEQYVERDAQAELVKRENVLCPVTNGAQGWTYFFDTAVYSMAPICGDTALVMFYHPYSDTALLTVWVLNGKKLAVADAELFMGDFIRRGGETPFDPEPYWLRAGMPPVIGLAAAANNTIDAFQRLYGGCTKASDLARWDKQLANVFDEETMYWNQVAVGLMFERNVLAVEELFGDAAAKPVAARLEELITQLSQGEANAVLQEATETNATAAAVVKGLTPTDWKRMTAVSFVDSADNSLVFLAVDGVGDKFYSLLFAKGKDGAKLRRIDTVDFHAAYRNRQQFAGLQGGDR